MVSLKTFIGKILLSLEEAREVADVDPARLAEPYTGKQVLKKIKIILNRIEATVKDLEKTQKEKKKSSKSK